MPRPIRTVRLFSEGENALLWLRRTWDGPTLVLGDGPLNVVVIDEPGEVVVPLGENRGSVSRQRIVEAFHRAAPFGADVYVVEVTSGGGERRYGMFAAPTWIEPSLRVT